MNPVNPIYLRLALLLAASFSYHTTAAVTHYVDLNSPGPVSPYVSWGTAARTIQSAVDAASAGDVILVTNGVYQTGGRVSGVLFSLTTNRLVVSKALTIQSVNGPGATVIQGNQVPGTTNGTAAVRCVYLTNNATLSGFTLSSGATRTSTSSQDGNGGGVLCAASTAILTNCVLSGNAAAFNGGGAYGGTLKNCTLTGNWSGSAGGGANAGTLNGCALYGNYSANTGGGADTVTLNNCTVVGNSAGNSGGGFYSLNLGLGNGANNCIIYFNAAPAYPNYYAFGPGLNYCCTTPLPGPGPGNISSEPQLASFSHLSSASPCRGAGSATYATGVDIDGEAWASPPSIGCDEYRAGSVTGPLVVAIQASYTNVATGFLVDFSAQISGRINASRWDFGDGTAVSNRPFVSHAWVAAGDYIVTLQAYNESNPSGVSTSLVVHVTTPPVYYVSVNGTNPVPPYASWATAATNIHDAIDATSLPGALVMVSDGLYTSGGRKIFSSDVTNRLAIMKPVTVQSLNGSSATTIQGYQIPGVTFGTNAVRCAYLANGACLIGFTLTNGATAVSGRGAGALCASTRATLLNCIVAGNASSGTAGGVYSGTLNNCAIFNNSATTTGGGAYLANLTNCTVVANSALSVGGVYSSVVNNSIVFYNTASSFPDYDTLSTFSYSCSTPISGSGPGNIALEPQLASLTHLATNSPCRGAGNAAYASVVDIDGEAWASPPSMGCDEVYPGSINGPLTAAIQAPYTNLVAGFGASFTALISGRPSSSVWNLGDGTSVTNKPVMAHSWSAPGDYPVVLQAFNESNPAGVSSIVTVHVVSESFAYTALGSTNPVAPYNSWDTAATNIQDAVDAVYPGGRVLVSDGVYQTGGRVVFGSLSNRVAVTKPVTVQSANGPGVTFIQGYQVTSTTNGDAAVRCVYLTNSATLSGFTLTNGATRSGGDPSQEQSGGGVWCWSAGAVVSNCVLSGNACDFGGGAANSGTLNDCTLLGNSSIFGGGAYASILNRCVLIGNAGDQGGGAISSVINDSVLAGNTSTFGGGALDSKLNNCLVISNTSSFTGGGTDAGYLTNCTIVGNSAATAGGGAYAPIAQNCVIFYNSSPSGTNFNGGTLNYCCTPQVPFGTGNITNEPLFFDPASGNLRLQSVSPCINAGYPAVMPPGPDLDGNPRVVGSTVDIGAYEYQFPLSLISYAWLQQYGLPTDGSADSADTDGDGMNNFQEWIAGTIPTDPTSSLRLLNPTVTPSNVLVRWPGVAGRSYFVQRGTNLAAFSSFTTIATNVIGISGTNTFRDTTASGPGSFFYHLGVHF